MTVIRIAAIVLLVVYTLAGFGVHDLPHPDGWLGAALTLWCAADSGWRIRYWR